MVRSIDQGILSPGASAIKFAFRARTHDWTFFFFLDFSIVSKVSAASLSGAVRGTRHSG